MSEDALVWGASGGIGSAIITALKEQGMRVFAAARDELKIPQESDHTYAFNASDPASIDAVISACAYETDGFDLIVYAAGGVRSNPLDRLEAKDWQHVLDANLNGAYFAAKSSLPLLKKGGHMMFIGAYVEKIILPRMGAYTAAKAGLEAMTQILQKENRKVNITLVRPPAVDTPFWENAPFKLPQNAITPATVANAVLEQYRAGEAGTLDIPYAG